MAMSTERNLKIGTVLLNQGAINQLQLTEALDLQRTTKKRLGEILMEKMVIDEDQFLQALSQAYQLPIVDFNKVDVDEKVLGLFPFAMLKKYRVFPLELRDQSLTVAISDPLDMAALQEMRYVSGYQIKPVLASVRDISTQLENARQSIETMQAIRNAESDDVEETPIIKLVNSIIKRGINEGASDIHVEPQKDGLRVRFRIDGMLFKKSAIPQALARKVISRIKIMAGMDVTENRKPQDGRISWKEGAQSYDIRVATLLDMNGEAIALRILNKKSISHHFDSLGLENEEIERIKDLIKRPYGILLVTGPTGAGKTTTLYTILNALNQMSSNIITVEDPVEYQLEGITQTSINPHTGYTFANAIRHILRHDPDIIMVGEIRDVETAEVSVRAALTGHLVLATLHTNSAAGAITRLLEMNVEPFLLSSTVIGVVAQRLIRRLCPHCKKEVSPSAEVAALISTELHIEAPFMLCKPVGCDRCFQTGYSGRIGLFEILKVTQDLHPLILRKASDQEITKAMVAHGMRTLRQAGYKKAIEGLTSYEEVVRITLTEDI
jgi:type IV pilus assembly protein PilB